MQFVVFLWFVMLKMCEMVVWGIVVLMLVVGLMFVVVGVVQVEICFLKFYFVYIGECVMIIFKCNGKFDLEGFVKFNWFLCDWCCNELIKMDFCLFDLIWLVYQKSGLSDYINVFCGYCVFGMNEMLCNCFCYIGVVKESQYIFGKVMDFYIFGVLLEWLCEIGLKLQMGGVGYYLILGLFFVYMDVGGVCVWFCVLCEMLVCFFFDGKMIYVLLDGKLLFGYEVVMVDYKCCMGFDNIEIVFLGGCKNFFQMLFGGGDEDESLEVIMDNVVFKVQLLKVVLFVMLLVQVVIVEFVLQLKQIFIENILGMMVVNVLVFNVCFFVVGGQSVDLEMVLVLLVRSLVSVVMVFVLQLLDVGNGDYVDFGNYKILVL